MTEQLTPVVPHTPTTAPNLPAAYSNATALFEAAVLSQLAIILKNQEEVKNQMVKLERNIAHVAAAHRSAKATTTTKNLKLQRHLRQMPKNEVSMVSPTDTRMLREDGSDMRMQRMDSISGGFQRGVDLNTDPRFQRVTMCGTPTMFLPTKNFQQPPMDMQTDSIASDSNSSPLHDSPTDETLVVVPQDHASPCNMPQNPNPISPQQTLNTSDQRAQTDSAPRVFTIDDSLDSDNMTRPLELQHQSNSMQSSPAMSSPVMNVIHPASMVSQATVPPFPQPFSLNSSSSFISKLNDTSPSQVLPVLNESTFHTQDQQHSQEQMPNHCQPPPSSAEATQVAAKDSALISAGPVASHLINDGIKLQDHEMLQQSSIGSQIVPDRIHDNNLQDQLQMSSESNDHQQHGGSIHAIYPLPEDNKPSFDQNSALYSAPPGGPFNHSYEEQYNAFNNGLAAIKDEPKTFDFSQTDLMYLRRNSISIKNFAKKLAEEVYTYEELKLSNCSGTKGKLKLDPDRLRRIKTAVFETYDIGTNEQKATWTQCKDAINEFCRRKPNKYEYR